MKDAITPVPGTLLRLRALLQQELARRVAPLKQRGTAWLAVRPFRRRMKRRIARSVPVSEQVLRDRYATLPLASEPERFVLYRIIGNDLQPRHAPGQTLTNLAFILAHEPPFPDCEKRWILNRIHDPVQDQAIVALLREHGQDHLRLPFDTEAYFRTGWDPSGLPRPELLLTLMFEQRLHPEERDRIEAHLRRPKNLVAIHNNAARNLALADGRGRAKWILPFDGNCYFTAAAFEALRAAVTAAPWHPYHVVPMARVGTNEALLSPGFRPESREEPQILFRRDAAEQFDAQIPYGFRPKVDLFWRLGIRGPWDRYAIHAYDPPHPCLAAEAGTVGQAGWVARLSSGRTDLEVGNQAFRARSRERNQAIIATLDRLDAEVLADRLRPGPLFFDPDRIAALGAHPDTPLAQALRQAAAAALGRGPYSVMDKSGLPPSGDPHDYFSAALYYWPNPLTRSGRPYVRVDGHRIPGALGHGPAADRHDRSRLQAFLNDTLVLALAHQAFAEPACAAHARWLLRTWFLEPITRMTPHLRYAQVRFRDGHDEGQSYGVIEFREIAYLLDAVQLLGDSGALPAEDLAGLQRWFKAYITWLEESPQGRRERQQPNNRGVFYDVQIGAIAVFLRQPRLASRVRNRAPLRLLGQVGADGSLFRELARATPRHYVAFSLAGLTALARVSAHLGDDLWAIRGSGPRQSLAGALAWLAEVERKPAWQRRERDNFPVERLAPLWHDATAHGPDPLIPRHWPDADQPILPAEFGIPPFWMLQRAEVVR